MAQQKLDARSAGPHPVLVDLGGGSVPGGPAAWELDTGMMSYPGGYDADEVPAGFRADVGQAGTLRVSHRPRTTEAPCALSGQQPDITRSSSVAERCDRLVKTVPDGRAACLP
ncbi:hypothetical protein NMG29_24940 [Streptomyces cocklensis]|uniref:Uncharacterized protein n=1 Tax=Actinacidiphila cocklensis TaxID=887465 RepID=A0A9W4GV09_9ACTN|nr:hypothetical protein [Actinacidiphila cocklensis]MDD1061423.1 hypothetical protein [Actinacidiphila cocklensis]CAG6397437.1 hypothetical protein SCOCK_540038 [Actinacidiphila cocklensis]